MTRVQVRKDSEEELCILHALEALHTDPGLSIRATARKYGVPRSTLTDRYKGKTKPRREAHISQQLFTPEEENAIEAWIGRLDDIGIPPRLSHLHEMTSSILQQRNNRPEQNTPIGDHWVTRFLNRHPEIAFRFSGRIDNNRAAAGNPNTVNSFFNRLSEIRSRFSITFDDTYNADEKGFAIGQAKQAKALVRRKRKTSRTRQPGNREWVSVFECVSARGRVLPAFVIYKGKSHLVGNHDYEERDEATFALSDSGWSDDKLGFLWLKTHFDPLTTPTGDSNGHRLLIIDGHSSHLTLEFIEYCLNHKIHLLCLPAHSTHLLQPLDVGLFSPLKQYYSNLLDLWTRTHPYSNLNKGDFFPLLMKARRATFTEKNIQSAFAATGISPFRRHQVLNILQHLSTAPQTTTSTVPTTAREVQHLKSLSETSQSVTELQQICSVLATAAGTAFAEKAIALETVRQLTTAQKKSRSDRRQISKARVITRVDLDRLRKLRLEQDEKKKVQEARRIAAKVQTTTTTGKKRSRNVNEDPPVAQQPKRSRVNGNRGTGIALGGNNK